MIKHPEHCMYCQYHEMVNDGRVGEMRCPGSPELRGSVVHIRVIDPAEHFNPKDCTGVCKLYKVKEY